jgi:pyruvate dehydrogenase E2 component (dihydrolipoamide acetyltransferase)
MWKVEIPKTESKVEEATLAKWYKKEGDKVQKDELIAEIETFKALIEINSPHDGILHKIIVQEGETVPVNTVIAIIAQEGETISEEDLKPFLESEEEKEGKEEKVGKKGKVGSSQKETSPVKEKVKIAPAARKLASEKKIDISLVNGTGPDGAITKKDIQDYISQEKEQEDFNIKEIYQLTKVQQLSADRLTESYKNIPQFTLFRKINIASLLEKRKKINSQSELHLSLIDFIIEALILSFEKFPEFNAVSTKESYKYKLVKDINIALALATDRGLMVPVLKDLAGKSISEIARLRIEITKKSLEGKLQPEDFEQGTFTITNLGLQGIEYFTPIINPPQVAILGIGIVNKEFLPISLVVDHRIIDGIKGADFLNILAEQLAFNKEGGE